jgi:hypothetical protein
LGCLLLSNLRKGQDDLHIRVYDDDIGDHDSIGSAKIDLEKQIFGKGKFEQWIKLPAMMGLRSKGEIHVIIEHRVMCISTFIFRASPSFFSSHNSDPSKLNHPETFEALEWAVHFEYIETINKI